MANESTILTQEELDTLLMGYDDSEHDEERVNEILDHFETDAEELAKHDEIATKLQAYVDEGLAHLDTPEKIETVVEAQAATYYEKFVNSDKHLCGVQHSEIDNLEKFKTLMLEFLNRYVELSIGDVDGSMGLAGKLLFSSCMQLFFGDIIYDKMEE